MIAFNPNTRLSALPLAEGAATLLQLDDALLDLASLHAYCQTLDFTPDPRSYYPGVRALMPQPYAVAMLEALYPLLQQLVKPPAHFRLRPRQLYFSLLTTAAAGLQPAQRIPHFDTPSPYHVAVLHHLSAGPHGGTGFFQHRSTGLYRVGPAEQAAYFAALQQDLTATPPPAAYPSAATAGFTLYQTVSHQANRLLLYPGNLLHSALVDSQTDLSADPARGRLTANLFVEFVAPG